MAEEYQVKITTQGDPRGAEKVAESLQKVTKSASDQGKQARSLGDDMASLGARQNATKDVVEGLDSALRGNAASFFGVAKAATNLWEVLTVSTPMGRLVQLGLIAVNTFSLVSRHLEETGKKAGEAVPGVDALAEAMRKAGEAKTEGLAKALTAIKSEAKGAADELERVLSLQQQILKSKGEDDVQGQRAIDDMRLGQQFSAALQTKEQTAAVRDSAADELAQIEGNLNVVAGQRDTRQAVKRELESLGPVRGGSTVANVEHDKRVLELTRMLGGLPDPDSPEGKQYVENQKARAKQLRANLDKAAAEAAAADEAFRTIARTVVGLNPDGSAIREPSVAIARGREDRKRREAAGIPEPPSNIDTSRTVEGVGEKEPPLVIDGRSNMAAEGAKTGAEIARKMAEEFRAYGDSLLRKMEDELKAQRDQIKALRR